MRQRLVHLFVCFAMVALCACAHQGMDVGSPDIAGLWKHADKSAWIQIGFRNGVGAATVTQHDGNAAAQGLAILQDIRKVPDAAGSWQGKIYSAEADGFVDASLELLVDGALVISSADGTGKTVEVLRLIRDKNA